MKKTIYDALCVPYPCVEEIFKLVQEKEINKKLEYVLLYVI